MAETLSSRRVELSGEALPVWKLRPEEVRRMFHLMECHYEAVSEASFIRDLNNKDYVCLLRREDRLIMGFSTLAVNPYGVRESGVNILFSGDTIVSPECWGSSALVRLFCRTVGGLMATDTDKAWYWYLISKGHRTYQYLPLFCRTYYPAMEPMRQAPLVDLAARISFSLFGNAWKREEGVLRFPHSQGQLNAKLAGDTWRKAHNPQVDFFLKKNPGFHQGEELVCLASLAPENVLREAAQWIREGMRTPLPLEKHGQIHAA